MTEVTVSEATNYYYSLKDKYESQIQKQKDKIMEKESLSRKEKREEGREGKRCAFG